MLSLQEKETIILFNEADKTAEVYTHNKTLQNKLSKLAKSNEDCVLDKQDKDSMTFTVPKKWIKVSPPKSMNLTAKQRQQIADRFHGTR